MLRQVRTFVRTVLLRKNGANCRFAPANPLFAEKILSNFFGEGGLCAQPKPKI